ncbi:MAG: glycosyltransferase family 2 protein [Muribaculum sp.]|nr:glycosyltransferase family 2 protein [Muribaculum sp.]
MTSGACDIVTLVVPVHNRAGLVGDMLASVSMQTALPSVILVDNNSTDSTYQVLNRWADGYPAPVKLLKEETPGATAARNCGLQYVTTPYVMFFDSDDLMAPNHIERFVEAVKNRKEVDIVGWDIMFNELDGSHRLGKFSADDMWFRHTFNAILSTQRYGVRTDLIRKAGGWDVDLPGWNDYELGFRLLAQKPETVKLYGSPTVTVRRQAESITGAAYSSAAGRWEKSLQKCCDDVVATGNTWMLPWFRLRRAVLAAIYYKEGAEDLAKSTLKAVLAEVGTRERVLLRTAYHYARRGGRGIHYLLRPLL